MTLKILCVKYKHMLYSGGDCVSQHSEDNVYRYFMLDTYTIHPTVPRGTIPVVSDVTLLLK